MNKCLLHIAIILLASARVSGATSHSGDTIIRQVAADTIQTTTPSDTVMPESEKGTFGFVGDLWRKAKNYFDHTNDEVDEYKRFNMSFIGGPYYSSDVKFAIGLVASAQYRANMNDSLLQPSEAALKAQVSTTLFYSVGIGGVHLFPGDCRRIVYNVKFQSLPTYFWGVGYRSGSSHTKSAYKELSMAVNADYLTMIDHNFYIGPSVDFKYITARDRKDNQQLWDGMHRQSTSVGIGLKCVFDTRDVITAPEKGWYLALSQRFYPHFLGNSNHSFSLTEVELSHYKRVWNGGVLAERIHGCFTYGKTPWGMMPTFGDVGMRGYYYGRYRDKCEMDVTIELRQHVWRRNGFVCWIGAGTVAPDLGGFRWKRILPNAGIGYRWEFKKRVNVRVDFGIGKGTTGFEFNINETF